jgi:uncharacterized protein HemX
MMKNERQNPWDEQYQTEDGVKTLAEMWQETPTTERVEMAERTREGKRKLGRQVLVTALLVGTVLAAAVGIGKAVYQESQPRTEEQTAEVYQRHIEILEQNIASGKLSEEAVKSTRQAISVYEQALQDLGVELPGDN